MKLEALYTGRVQHARHEPVVHRFEHPMLMVWIDLDADRDRVVAGPPSWCWRFDGPALFSLYRRDYFGAADRPLGACIRELVAARTGQPPPARVCLLTQPRFLGFAINPVSFYYCYDAQGRRQAIVAEVTNTPWNETHCYVLDVRAADRPPTGIRVDKDLHVSPFMPMEQHYEFAIGEAGDELALAIRNFDATRGESLFSARLELERGAASPAALRRAALHFPFMPHRVLAAIYLHALRLAFAGVPFHPHPSKRTSCAEVSP